MKLIQLNLLVFIIAGVIPTQADAPQKSAPTEQSYISFTRDAWSSPPNTMRPWTYWWWPGSAVDEKNITRQLQLFKQAGLGGVHIIPIYGVKGYEDMFIKYLSPKWMNMLAHTTSEADRLGLGVDMTTGTGWCFGGPNVSDNDANASVVVRILKPDDTGRLERKLDADSLQALVAFSEANASIDLTDAVRKDGQLQWSAPAGQWRVFAVSQKPSGRDVKRSAPGGSGHMLNLFYPDAVRRYLERFSSAFSDFPGIMPRAMYHDSYEYRSDWSPTLFAKFEQRRGYKLQEQLPALFDQADPDLAARVKYDYRRTISDIMAEESLPAWVDWSHSYGMITRNEAHGSPGNLLDLYAAADIPETEMFHTDRNILISKFASSAAHVSGKQLVSSETGTWLDEHFNVTLAELKYLVDDLFLSGVNHVIYHGTCYSPEEAPWPGWLFYASTEMNPRNAIWHDVPALNNYIARSQSVLQSGKPDNDVLLYWPIHDYWHDADGLVQHLSVHARDWFKNESIGALARMLWEDGFAFDYVSDRQLEETKVDTSGILTPGGTYSVILVPECTYMPVSTLSKLLDLSQNGATVIFENSLPLDAPGLAELKTKRRTLTNLLSDIELDHNDAYNVDFASRGTGRIIIGETKPALDLAGIQRETITDHPGLFYIRRSDENSRFYFIANRGDNTVSDWINLSTSAHSVQFMNPLTGDSGSAEFKTNGDKTISVFLRLFPGESIVVRALHTRKINDKPWKWPKPNDTPIELDTEWKVDFVQGAPTLPESFTTKRLESWTELGGKEAKRFAGTARYTTEFDVTGDNDSFVLDLGDVRHSARVRLNNRTLGTVFTPPYRVIIDQLESGKNKLEIEVTNLSANRIRDLDRRGTNWKIFYNINFVDIDYNSFDASDWPIEKSGLLGPIRLIPLE
ncbi:MAG: hypothetical protein K9N48_01900 [Verrucomicrobia bacterium]|nr:hypothetical protein [Verrucomicrobiota bacterium]